MIHYSLHSILFVSYSKGYINLNFKIIFLLSNFYQDKEGCGSSLFKKVITFEILSTLHITYWVRLTVGIVRFIFFNLNANHLTASCQFAADHSSNSAARKAEQLWESIEEQQCGEANSNYLWRPGDPVVNARD